MAQPVGLERFEISGANLPAMKDRPAKGQGVFRAPGGAWQLALLGPRIERSGRTLEGVPTAKAEVPRWGIIELRYARLKPNLVSIFVYRGRCPESEVAQTRSIFGVISAIDPLLRSAYN